MHITVWNEFINHDKGKTKRVYPNGLQNTIAEIFKDLNGITTSAVTLLMPEQGLTDELLNKTDVLIWWSHGGHALVKDELAAKIVKRVKEGQMGCIFLHSAHVSKPFKLLMGASGNLNWRDVGERERIWTVKPSHEIAYGIPESFVLKHEEMYGEYFDVGEKGEPIFIGWFKGGEIFRSGIIFESSEDIKGKFFYFQPGHETYKNFYDENIRKIIFNATMYVAPKGVAPSAYMPKKTVISRNDCAEIKITPEFKAKFGGRK